jgi:hypothetical protein
VTPEHRPQRMDEQEEVVGAVDPSTALDEDDDLDDVDEESASQVIAPEDTSTPTAGAATDDDSDQASLDELLAQRTGRRGTEDAGEETDIMSFPVPREERPPPPVRIHATPMRARDEFVCSNCHLVKPRVQLADQARGLCRDCA